MIPRLSPSVNGERKDKKENSGVGMDICLLTAAFHLPFTPDPAQGKRLEAASTIRTNSLPKDNSFPL